MKTTIRFVCVVLLVGAMAMIFANQKIIARLRVEHEELLGASREAAKLTEENQQLEQLRRDNVEVEKLRRENKDLPKLRNDVRQLRRVVDELNKLRAENERLASRPSAAAAQPGSRTLPPGFIPRAQLADVGLATPQAAVETFFWAMSTGNINRLDECSIEGESRRNPTTRTWTEDMESRRLRVVEQMNHFTGYAITSVAYPAATVVNTSEALITVQSSVEGTVMGMHAVLFGDEWKVGFQ